MTASQPARRWTALISSPFLRATGVLVTGTAAGQLIVVLSLPLLTRLYSPGDLTILAVYTAALSIMSVIACARLEVAIPLPESDKDAANLLVLSLAASSILAAVCGLVVAVWGEPIAGLTGRPQVREYLWMLPLGLWLAGNFSALYHWGTRKKLFHSIAKARVSQAAAGVSVQAGMGAVAPSPFGLLLGHLVLTGSGWLVLGWRAWHDDKAILKRVSWAGMRDNARKYQRFPKYSVPESLANTLGIQLPVLLIASAIAGPEAGFLFLAMRAVGTPVSLVGAAVAQVYLSRAPDAERKGELGQLTHRIVVGLGRVGLIGLGLALVVAPPLFEVVFGDDWRRAGVLVTWMMPWFFLKLLVSPISMVMHVRMLQKTMLVLTLTGMVLRVGSVIIAAMVSGAYLAEAYCVSSALYYLFLLVVITRLGGVKLTNVLLEIFWLKRSSGSAGDR